MEVATTVDVVGGTAVDAEQAVPATRTAASGSDRRGRRTRRVYAGMAADAIGEAYCTTDACEIKLIKDNQ